MINEEFVIAHRQRSMNPDRPVLRARRKNPDVFFQAREPAIRSTQVPDITAKVMDQFAAITAANTSLRVCRRPNAEQVLIIMGSGVRRRRRRQITSMSAAGKSACSRCASTAHSACSVHGVVARKREVHCGARPDPKNPARWASRSIWISWPP